MQEMRQADPLRWGWLTRAKEIAFATELISRFSNPSQGMGRMVQTAVAEDLSGELFHVRHESVDRLDDPFLSKFIGGKGDTHPLQGMSG